MKEVRNVECGRVAFIAKGDCQGKLGVIAEIIDQNRVLIDGPFTGVIRQPMNVSNLHLTALKIHLPHGSRTRVVRKEWLKADVSSKWEASTWAKKLKQKAIRANLNDYERFQVRYALRMRNKLINAQFHKLKKSKKEVKA